MADRSISVSAYEMKETALDFFLADAARLGMTPGEYEREFGVILDDPGIVSAATQRIRRHELSSGLMSPDDLALARHQEGRRTTRT